MMHPRQPTNPSCICTRTHDTTHLECSSGTVQVRFRPNPNHASHLRFVITSLMHDSIRGVARIPTSLRKRISRDPTPKPTPPTTNTPDSMAVPVSLGPQFRACILDLPTFSTPSCARGWMRWRRAARRGWKVFEREGTGKVIEGRKRGREGRICWLFRRGARMV